MRHGGTPLLDASRRRIRIFRLAAVALSAACLFVSASGGVAAPNPEAARSRLKVPGHYQTDVSGYIESDTTWTRDQSPIRVIGQLFVRGPATLTIEAGVTVGFEQNAELLVEGGLIAEGTADAPIEFVGGSGTPGSWGGIRVLGSGGQPGVVRLVHAVVAHGGGPGTNARAQIDISIGLVEIHESEIRDGGGGGIAMDYASLVVSRTSIVNNAGDAIEGDFVPDFNQPPYGDPRYDQLTISGNGTDAVVLEGGRITADTTWEDPGVPYRLDGQLFIVAPATLDIEPGVEVRSTVGGQLIVQGGGRLNAEGTADAPITLLGEEESAGSWGGVLLSGSSEGRAEANFRYTTISHAGAGSLPLIDVSNGRLTFRDGKITDSSADGVRVTGDASVVVDNSDLVGIGGTGLVNETTALISAPNNWWGSADGPRADGECGNASATGTRIQGPVVYSPWRRSAEERPDPLAPAQVGTLTLQPQRWFAPADGVTRIWVDVYLHDPEGRPISGAVVNLLTTSGQATSGGITDPEGHTLAYITSSQLGDAEIGASLGGAHACEQPQSTTAQVTFTAAGDDLLAGMQAPYVYDGITVTPEPVVTGVPTTVSARLTNPNATPITVEAEFGFAQSGIGLAFGPIGRQTKEIPANAEQTFEATFTPTVTGHYCVEVLYRIVGGESAGVRGAVAAVDLGTSGGPPDVPGPFQQVSGGGGGRSGLRNIQVEKGNPDRYESIAKARNAGKFVSKVPGGHPLTKYSVGRLTDWLYDNASRIADSLFGDPPRQDYTLIAQPERPELPAYDRPAEVSEERFAAQRDLEAALLDVVAVGDAAVVTIDRYGGAAAAGDLGWASAQMSALLHYRKQVGAAMVEAADKMAALKAVIEREQPDGILITVDDVLAEQERLQTQGFAADEIEAARMLRWTDDQIEAVRQDTLATPPEQVAGRFTDKLAEAEAAYRQAGLDLQLPGSFPQEPERQTLYGNPVAGQAGADAASNLARVYQQTSTIQVGNPLDHETTIDLRVRRVSLPEAWIAEVSPASVTLAPGEQATVTVNVTPTTAVPQGSQATLAVEGYAEQQLLGGVAVTVLVPNYVPFGATPGGDQSTLLIIGVLVAIAALVTLALLAFIVLRRRRRVSAGTQTDR